MWKGAWARPAMNTFVSLYWSTVGRKFWTALTGICLVGFVIVHLEGNLNCFRGTNLPILIG